MKNSYYLAVPSSLIYLAIDAGRLESLIKEGRLNVTDFSCLDSSSKKNVWTMLRSLAAKRLARL